MVIKPIWEFMIAQSSFVRTSGISVEISRARAPLYRFHLPSGLCELLPSRKVFALSSSRQAQTLSDRHESFISNFDPPTSSSTSHNDKIDRRPPKSRPSCLSSGKLNTFIPGELLERG